MNNVTILHQNIAGLLNKLDLLSISLENFRDDNIEIDVICITEHFLLQIDIPVLPNYKMSSCYARDTRRGGSCIFIRNGHSFQDIPWVTKLSMKCVIECSAVELISHNIIVLCVYRVPNSKIEIFLDKLHIILMKLTSNNSKKIVLCGDFNINIMTKNNSTADFEHLLLNFNLKLRIKQPTRLTSNTCIDNIADNIRGCKAEVVDLALSDHTAQILMCPVKKTDIITSWHIKRRDYSKDNLSKFTNCIKELSFYEVYNTINPNEI